MTLSLPDASELLKLKLRAVICYLARGLRRPQPLLLVMKTDRYRTVYDQVIVKAERFSAGESLSVDVIEKLHDVLDEGKSSAFDLVGNAMAISIQGTLEAGVQCCEALVEAIKAVNEKTSASYKQAVGSSYLATSIASSAISEHIEFWEIKGGNLEPIPDKGGQLKDYRIDYDYLRLECPNNGGDFVGNTLDVSELGEIWREGCPEQLEEKYLREKSNFELETSLRAGRDARLTISRGAKADFLATLRAERALAQAPNAIVVGLAGATLAYALGYESNLSAVVGFMGGILPYTLLSTVSRDIVATDLHE